MKHVLYVPALNSNLFCVAAAASQGKKVRFDDKMCEVVKNDKTFMMGRKFQNLYYLDTTIAESSANLAASLITWHQR